MNPPLRAGATLGILAAVANGQEAPPPRIVRPCDPGAFAGRGLDPESLPSEIAEDVAGAADDCRLGPTPVSEVGLLRELLGIPDQMRYRGISARSSSEIVATDPESRYHAPVGA